MGSLPVCIMFKQQNRDSNGGYVWKYPAHVTATERLYAERFWTVECVIPAQ